MKILLMAIAIIAAFAISAYAVDEDTYVRLTADTVIAMHNYRGNIAEMSQWINTTRSQNPDFMGSEWQAFEASVAADAGNKQRVYNRILQNVQSKGHKARLSSFGSGSTAVEIDN